MSSNGGTAAASLQGGDRGGRREASPHQLVEVGFIIVARGTSIALPAAAGSALLRRVCDACVNAGTAAARAAATPPTVRSAGR
jgi:hypothetical protein